MALREYDVEFESIKVHCWEGGSGFPILMMHGSGPGVSTVGNWRHVLEPLAERYRVLAFDLIGFGLSGRKREKPYFDLALWQRQAQHMLARLPDGPAGIIAHSLSGALALRVAAANARVTKLVTTGTLGAAFPINPYLAAAWKTPRTAAELRETFEPAVYDRSAITDEFVQNRMAILAKDGYGAHFSAMFEGDKQRYIDACVAPPEALAGIRGDVLMMHGRNDVMVPFETSTLALAPALPRADIVAVGCCGHGVAQEHPDKFLRSVVGLLG